MNDTVKLIIEIPRNEYEYTCERTLSDRTFWDDAIRKGTPLDDVKAEIAEKYANTHHMYPNYASGLSYAYAIIDKHIGKEESEVKPNE